MEGMTTEPGVDPEGLARARLEIRHVSPGNTPEQTNRKKLATKVHRDCEQRDQRTGTRTPEGIAARDTFAEP